MHLKNNQIKIRIICFYDIAITCSHIKQMMCTDYRLKWIFTKHIPNIHAVQLTLIIWRRLLKFSPRYLDRYSTILKIRGVQSVNFLQSIIRQCNAESEVFTNYKK